MFLAVGALKDLRRRALAELGERRLAARRRTQGRPAPARGNARADVPESSAVRRPARAPRVVLRLRPGETPLPLPSGGAYCLDVLAGDDPVAVAVALEALRAHGSPVRVRLPEVLFDADAGVGGRAPGARRGTPSSRARRVFWRVPAARTSSSTRCRG